MRVDRPYCVQPRQKVGRHDCAFVNKKGHIGKARNCHKVPKSDLLRAHGTTRWTFGIKLRSSSRGDDL